MNPLSVRLTPIALVVLTALLSAPGCLGGLARTISTVELPPMSFSHESAPIDGTIELCLTPKLRMRQWNVASHPFKIDLGSRAALNLEILAKSAFREVIVSFDRTCGSATDHPWLSATILAANRDWDSLWSTEQNTTITMEFELAGSDAGRIWSTTTRGDVTTSPPTYTQRRVRAAEDFGEALGVALEQGFDELLESEEVRDLFRAGPSEESAEAS